MEALRAAGIPLEVVALRPPPPDLPDMLRPLAAEAPQLRSSAAATAAVLRRPAPARLLASRRAPRRGIGLLRGAALALRLDAAHDHVHAQFPLDAATAGLFASLLSGCGFSFSGHTLHELDLMAEKLRAAALVVVGSEFERRVLRTRYGDHWDDRIQVRRLGVPPRQAGRERVPWLVVSVGTLAPKKGHDVLVRAIAALAAAGRPVRLELVGEGPQRAELERLVAELGVADRVSFAGALPHEDALALVASASAFALCCRVTADGDHDCLPVALMDAMSVATPCVSSDLLGIPELIDDGVSGLLAPPERPDETASRLEVLLADPALARRLGDVGRERVRDAYDLDRNVARLAALFREHLGA